MNDNSAPQNNQISFTDQNHASTRGRMRKHKPQHEEQETYSIGQAAKMLGVPSSTLRFYEKEHLLPHISRSSTGLRRYCENDLRLAQLIECLKATGMPLIEIRSFVELVEQGDASIDARLEFFHRQQRRLEEQREALEAQQNALDFKVWYYSCAQQAGTTQAPEHLLLQGVKQRPQILRIAGIDAEAES